MEKTNVMRILDQANISYNSYTYSPDLTNGEEVAKSLSKDPSQAFKTLVTVSNTLEHLVFVIPVNQTLNLKKASKAAGVKSVEMIKQKELFNLTGYIHGGCSPIGMKKKFRTFIDETAMLFDTIIFSAGKVGYQVEVNPNDLINLISSNYFELTD